MRRVQEKMLSTYDILEDYLSQMISDLKLCTKEYFLYRESDFTEIHMNSMSFPLFVKSLVVKNPQALFLCSLINAFQKLSKSNENETTIYRTTTHSLTVFYLRTLARYGIIKILDCQKCSEKTDYDEYYKVIGNTKPGHNLALYDIRFIKLCDLKEEDIEIINRLIRTFKIAEDAIEFKIIDGILTSKFNKKTILRNIKEKTLKFKSSLAQ